MQKALALLSLKFIAHRDALGHGVFLAPIHRIQFHVNSRRIKLISWIYIEFNWNQVSQIDYEFIKNRMEMLTSARKRSILPCRDAAKRVVGNVQTLEMTCDWSIASPVSFHMCRYVGMQLPRTGVVLCAGREERAISVAHYIDYRSACRQLLSNTCRSWSTSE